MHTTAEPSLVVKPAPRFRLWLYLLIVFGLSWPFMFVYFFRANSGAPIGQLEAQIWSGAVMFMVTVGTFIAGRWVFRDGFRTVGWRWGSVRSWALAFGLVLLIWGVPIVLETLVGNGLPASFQWSAFWGTLAYIFVDCVFGFGEEFGWRGYLLPRQWWLGPRWAVLANAVIWWAWHIPTVELGFFVFAPAIAARMNLSTDVYLQTVMLPQIVLTFVSAICAGIIFCYVWVRSGSIVVASVFHGAWGTARNLLMLWVASGNIIISYLPMLLFIAIALLLLWRGRWVLLTEVG